MIHFSAPTPLCNSETTGASVVAVGAVLLLLLSLVSECGLMTLTRSHSGLFGCCVCCLVPAAPVRVGCFLSVLDAWGLVCVLPFLCCWSVLVGRLYVLECAFWGFPLSFALLHLFPVFVLVTKRRNSWACIGNQKLEE